jgi:hypothetical protein
MRTGHGRFKIGDQGGLIAIDLLGLWLSVGGRRHDECEVGADRRT